MLNNLKLLVFDSISYISVCYIALALFFIAVIYILLPTDKLEYIEHVSSILKFHSILDIILW